MNHKIKIPLFLLMTQLIVSLTYSSEWKRMSIDSVSITAMFDFKNGHLIAGTDDNSNAMYESYDDGLTWDTLSKGPPINHYVNMFYFYNNTFYVGISGDYPALYTSKDSGKTWTGVNKTWWEASCYSMFTKDSIILCGATGYFVRSTDYGATWKSYQNADSLLLNFGCVRGLVKYKDTIYAGTGNGIYGTLDYGLTWQKKGLNISALNVLSIDFIDTIIMVGTYSGVFMSYFYGTLDFYKWKNVFCDRPWVTPAYRICDSLLFVYNYFEGTNTLYYSRDTAKTWKRFWLEDDTSRNILVNKFCNDSQYIFALTDRGIYRKPINTNVKIAEQNIKNVLNDILITCHANQIMITFKKSMIVNLELFSLNGKRTYFIKRKYFSSGIHSIDFSKIVQSKGVFCLRISFNGDIIQKKIILR